MSRRGLAWLLFAAVGGLTLLRILWGDAVWDAWIDRDLVRGATAWDHVPVLGAELSFGGGARVPGGLYEALMWVPVALGLGARGAFAFQELLALVGVGVLAWAVHHRFGLWPAAVAAGVYAGLGIVGDTLAHVWNPAFVPLPVAIAYAGLDRYLGDEDPRGLVLAVGGLLAAAQLHLAAALLLVGWLPVLLLAPVAGRARGWAGVGVVAALLFGPYLFVEAGAGWPNTHLLSTQQPLTAWAAEETHRLGDLWALPGVLAGGRYLAASTWAGALDQLPWQAGLLLAVAGAGLTVMGRAGRTSWAVLSGILLTLSAYVWNDQIELTTPGHGRYLIAVAPGLAWLAAEATAAWSHRSARILPAALVAASLLGAMGDLALLARHHANSDRAVLRVQAQMEELQERTGWPLDELVGRLSVWRDLGGVWGPDRDGGAHWWLHDQGLAWEGSRSGTCALVLAGWARRHEEPVVDEDLATVLGPFGLSPRIQRQETLALGHQLVWFDVDGPCPVSLHQRYLLTPAEVRIRDEVPADGAPVLLDDGLVVWRVGEADGQELQAVWAGMRLRQDGGRIQATLHSNQLRGQAWNDGWFADAVLDRPRLVLTSERGETRTLAFAPGGVGLYGPATPLTSVVAVPPGTWSVAFEAGRVPMDARRVPATFGVPVAVRQVLPVVVRVP